MKLELKNIFRQADPVMALAKSISVLLSYLVGSYVTGHFHQESNLLGAMLASVSGIVVLQEDLQTSIHQGWLRVLGTFIGAVIAYLYLVLFPFSLIGMVLSVFILDLLCKLVRIPDNGKMATITLIVVLIISERFPELPPLLNGTLRFTEASVGAGIAIGLAWLTHYIKIKK